jgi:hypothetical protein
MCVQLKAYDKSLHTKTVMRLMTEDGPDESVRVHY